MNQEKVKCQPPSHECNKKYRVIISAVNKVTGKTGFYSRATKRNWDRFSAIPRIILMRGPTLLDAVNQFMEKRLGSSAFHAKQFMHVLKRLDTEDTKKCTDLFVNHPVWTFTDMSNANNQPESIKIEVLETIERKSEEKYCVNNTAKDCVVED